MFGNLITNRQLKQLMKAKEIQIDPFDPQSLKITHYTLHPGCVLERHADGHWKHVHNFRSDPGPYIIRENAYVIIEVKEAVKIYSDGIVGRFVTTSNLIEAGLAVMAGQIDNKYGTKGEGLRFGLKNQLATQNTIDANTRLAHVEFFDLRGITVDPVKLTLKEEELWEFRRFKKARDDGPNYDIDQ